MNNPIISNQETKKDHQNAYFNELSNIQKHPLFSKYHLSQDEVLSNYEQLKELIDQHNLCTINSKCAYLKQHHLISQTDDQDHQFNENLEYFLCNKPINFALLSEKLLLNLLHKNIHTNKIDIQKLIDNIGNFTSPKFFEQLQKYIKVANLFKFNLFSFETNTLQNEKKPSLYLEIDNHILFNHKKLFFQEIQDLFLKYFLLFFAIYKNNHVYHYDSKELKQLMFKTFDDEKSQFQNLDQIKNVQNLIITNFGLENTNDFYYCNFLQPILEYRINNQLTTIIISPLNIKSILDNLKEVYKNKPNAINQYNLESFYLVIKNIHEN